MKTAAGGVFSDGTTGPRERLAVDGAGQAVEAPGIAVLGAELLHAGVGEVLHRVVAVDALVLAPDHVGADLR